MITLCAKLNRNLRYRVLFRYFFGRSVVECPTCARTHWGAGNTNRHMVIAHLTLEIIDELAYSYRYGFGRMLQGMLPPLPYGGAAHDR